MLYLTLLTPILALPAVLLMDRVERWAAGDTARPFRLARTAPIADVAAGHGGGPRPLPDRPPRAAWGWHLADPSPHLHRPEVAWRS